MWKDDDVLEDPEDRAVKVQSALIRLAEERVRRAAKRLAEQNQTEGNYFVCKLKGLHTNFF